MIVNVNSIFKLTEKVEVNQIKKEDKWLLMVLKLGEKTPAIPDES